MELQIKGDPPYEVHVYGPSDAKQLGIGNWSLSMLGHNNDEQERNHYLTVLGNILHDLGVRRAYAPETKTASAIVDDEAKRGAAVRMSPVAIYRRFDFPADGVSIDPGEAVIVSSVGCPVIIAHADDYLVVANVARDSLIERSAMHNKRFREHFSVVYAILDAFREKGTPANEVHLHMMLALSPGQFFHPFAHEKHGPYNRGLANYLRPRHLDMLRPDGVLLDLGAVFLAQAEQAGVAEAIVSHPLADFPELVQTDRDGAPNLAIIKRL